MADVNPAPIPGPGPVQVEDHPGDFCIFCFRDWCQGMAAMVKLDPEDYYTYVYITRNYYNQVTPYDQFQMQMKTLLERPDKEYRDLQPYWDAYHREYLENMPVNGDPLFFYPINLYTRLYRIPDYNFVSDPEQNSRIREHNRIEADRINQYRCNVQPVVRCPHCDRIALKRKRKAPNLEQAPLEGAADNKVETQTDTPVGKRSSRKRNAPNLEQAPLEGAADNKAETQMDIPRRKRSHRKRNAPNLEQAALEGPADNEVETQTDMPNV